MYPRNIRVESPEEALIAEQALAMYREMRQAATHATDGEVLSVAESLAVARGRELTRRSLETVLQEEIVTAEKKGRRARLFLRRAQRTSWLPIAKGSHGGWRGEAAARVLRVRSLSSRSTWRGRAYGHLRRADAPGRADVVPSRGQLVVCQRQPVFARAERLVRVGQQRAPGLPTGSAADRRLAGDSRSRRKVSYQPGSRRVSDRRHLRQHRPRLEGNARGRVCQTDAGRRGRASRVGHAEASCSGGAGGVCGPGRPPDVCRPLAGGGFAAGDSHRRPTGCLGRSGALDLGACRFSLCLCAGHVGHLSRAGACRPDRPGAVRRRDDGGSTLASRGAGRTVGGRLARHPARDRSARVVAAGAPQRTAVRRLADYLRPHAQHLDYRKRLASGRPIGSGCIEGACKNYLGRRLKQTGARWLIPNANRMATLGSLVYADQWTDYWANSN